jgi:uncharacterized membrane protein YccC
MSATEAVPPQPFLVLPGFAPDALGMAVRTTLALLLAYFLAFWSQLDSASTAGVCVAIISQASPGMTLSKALYRIAGTVLGGAVAVVMVAAFGQDRTMLLAGFTLWLAACTFVASLLRDFRSYGAVLCGYTVGIIAITGIDAPDSVLLVALNRVAAMLLGVAAMAVVNNLLARNAAFEGLLAGLRAGMTEMRTLAQQALSGERLPSLRTRVHTAAAILALHTQANYAATELPDGLTRTGGARATISGLLGMLAACRALDAGQRVAPAEPALHALLQQAAATLPDGDPAPLAFAATTPHEVLLLDQADDIVRLHARARGGLRTLEDGEPPAEPVRLRVHYDLIAAALTAARTAIAVGLGACFCVFSGYADTTTMLVQQAAFTALLGMQPDPSRSAATFGWALPLPALAVWVIGYLVLPGVSGFVLFALAVGPCAFVFSLLGQHPRAARFGPGFMLYFTLLLAPSNPESFDLTVFLNNVGFQMVTILFIVLSFRLILPVSRKRRLFRIAAAITRDLRRTLRRGATLDQSAQQSLSYDRLAQAETWLGEPTPARLAVLRRLHVFAELDIALHRAWSGLDRMSRTLPGQAAAVAAARAALLQHGPDALEAAARALLTPPGPIHPDVMRAVSGLYGAQILLGQQRHALRHYRVLRS